MEDPSSFSGRIHRMIKFALNVDEDEEVVNEDAPPLEEDKDESEHKMEGID